MRLPGPWGCSARRGLGATGRLAASCSEGLAWGWGGFSWGFGRKIEGRLLARLSPRDAQVSLRGLMKCSGEQMVSVQQVLE